MSPSLLEPIQEKGGVGRKVFRQVPRQTTCLVLEGEWGFVRVLKKKRGGFTGVEGGNLRKGEVKGGKTAKCAFSPTLNLGEKSPASFKKRGD